MDKIELMSFMANEDFMLHIMGNPPEEYEAVLTDLENRLMFENENMFTIELIHQKLNAC